MTSQQTVLDDLRAHGPSVIADISDRTGGEPKNVRRAMGHLERWGDVRRAGIVITASGQKAVVWEAVA